MQKRQVKGVREKIGFWEALSIGIGGMIGGGIFAVLGLSIQLSGGAAPISFGIAGLIALATAYSYAALSLRFPSRGGTIEFLIRGFGRGLLSGTLNVLLLASYIIMISLYAYAFGSYGATFFNNSEIAKHLLISLVVLIFTVINALGALMSGKTEDMLVAFKVAVLLFIIGVSAGFINWDRLSPETWASPWGIIAGGMIIFLAYEGFELIANASGDVENPEVLKKAFFGAVIVVIAIYIAIATVTVGVLPHDEIVKARDYALAAAAEPVIGRKGFILVTLAALASTASAINATLYGTARASYMVAKYGQLPAVLEKKVWKKAYEGLVIIAGISLIMANMLSLEAISIAGSSGFLLIFMFVNLAALKLRDKVKIFTPVPLMGALLTFSALVVLLYKIWEINPEQLGVFGGLLLGSMGVEVAYTRTTGRKLKRYADPALKTVESNIRNWEDWVYRAKDALSERFEDAEVYLVGSLARGETEKSCDVDLLVFTSTPPPKSKKLDILREIKQSSNLGREHILDIHYVHSDKKEESLKRAGKYIKLAK